MAPGEPADRCWRKRPEATHSGRFRSRFETGNTRSPYILPETTSASARVTRRNRWDCAPTRSKAHDEAPAGETVSTRMGSLNSVPGGFGRRETVPLGQSWAPQSRSGHGECQTRSWSPVRFRSTGSSVETDVENHRPASTCSCVATVGPGKRVGGVLSAGADRTPGHGERCRQPPALARDQRPGPGRRRGTTRRGPAGRGRGEHDDGPVHALRSGRRFCRLACLRWWSQRHLCTTVQTSRRFGRILARMLCPLDSSARRVAGRITGGDLALSNADHYRPISDDAYSMRRVSLRRKFKQEDRFTLLGGDASRRPRFVLQKPSARS
jgi:hypothetical protein